MLLAAYLLCRFNEFVLPPISRLFGIQRPSKETQTILAGGASLDYPV
jgi:hypothetical protein